MSSLVLYTVMHYWHPIIIIIAHLLEYTYAGVYTNDLMGLQSFAPHTPPPQGRERSCQINTPLKQIAWQNYLAHHPDRMFSKYICSGIANGFRIGFTRAQSLRSAKDNMKSAKEHPEVIEEYLSKEVFKRRTLELSPHDVKPIQISKFGVIPKKHQPGQWHLILDLSSPEEKSVNDGIDKSLCSLQYVKVEDVAKQVWLSGKGTLMAKTDIKSAFRIVPVHPDDRLLLGMQ